MCFIDFKFPFNYFFYNLIENLKCDKITANKYFCYAKFQQNACILLFRTFYFECM